MKKLVWFGLALTVFAAAAPSRAQDNTAKQQTITLYSPLQYHDQSRAWVDLQAAAYPPRYTLGDVSYGSLRVGDEFDWLEISAAQNNRSVIRDLGKYDWSEKFTVPSVEPLAKLQPGEQRKVFVAANGKDGKDGARGFDHWDALPGSASTTPDLPWEPPASRKPKRDAGVATSSNLIRANLGHIYVIHVVDDERDFYALVRVDSLQRGDNCTVSWKLIPAPQAK